MSGRRFVLRRSGLMKRRVDLTPRMEPLETRQLLTTYTVMSAADSGGTVGGQDLTLRAAIGLARGGDEIDFAIPGIGSHTIQLRTALPAISVPITIDGSTQGGATFSGTPLIVLDGSLITGNGAGLQLQGDSSTVRSLVIENFKGAGIDIVGNRMTIQGCYIGVDASGGAPGGNAGSGIDLESGSSSNTIGGSLPGQFNVISGNVSGIFGHGNNSFNLISGNRIGTDASGSRAIPNTLDGITLLGGGLNTIGGTSSTSNGINPDGNIISGNGFNGITIIGASSNAILGNFIGSSADGLSAVPNGGNGISIVGATNTVIGGTFDGNRNIISGNTGDGIQFTGGDFTAIVGNYIGVDATGASNLGNQGAGIDNNGASSVTIGGTAAGAGNVIAFNGNASNAARDDGIFIFSGSKISILGNSIFSNVGLGIDLWDIGDDSTGVTSNDTKDVDTGPNDLQNYPSLTFAATGSSAGGTGASNQTIVRGSLSSTPRATFVVEFFASEQPDPTGFGEGQIYLGRTTVTTDLSGNAPISITLPKGTIPGYFLTATATDPNGSTSEFSVAQPVVKAPSTDIQVITTIDPTTPTVNGSLVYTIKVTNNGLDDATGVVLTDTLPADIGPNPVVTSDQGTSSIANGVVTVAIGNLAKGASSTITITVVPLVAEQITNTAAAGSDGIDPDTSNNTSTTVTTVAIPADIAITETISPAGPLLDGQTFDYLVTITNAGPGSATGVVFNQLFSSNVTVLSASSIQGTYLITSNSVQGRIGNIDPNGQVFVRVNVRANNSGIVTDSAAVTTDQLDLEPGNNTTGLSVNILPAVDLGISVTAAAAPNDPNNQDPTSILLATQYLAYTITVTNNGPDDATGVTINDVLPPGVTFIFADDGVTPVDGTVTFDIGNLAAGDSVTKTVFIKNPDGSGKMVNNVTTSANETDANTADNTANLTTIVNPADLQVSSFTTPGVGTVGSPLTYHVVVTNNGPSMAHGVVLTDLLPSGVNLTGSSIDVGSIITNDGQTIVAVIGDLASGASATLTFVAVPNVSTLIFNTASVASQNGSDADIDMSNNTDSLSVAVSPTNLAVNVVPSSSSVLVGDPISYRVTVTNFGSADATGVALIDALPTNAELVSAVADDGSTNIGRIAGNLVAAIGNLAAGQSYTLTLTFKPLTEGTIVNTFSATGEQFDPDPTNNGQSISTPVTNALGVVNFSQAFYQSGDNAGTALITVTRTGGTKGTLTVGFSTSPGTAIPGTNYQPQTGTFTFGPGETVKTFLVPILDDGEVTGDKTVVLHLTDTGGSPIGGQGNAILNIVETDVDLIGPDVVDFQIQGTNRSITGAILTFSETLNKDSAEDIANYTLISPPTRSRHGVQNPTVIGAVYNASNNTVTLSFSQSPATGVFSQLIVNGNPGGVSDRFGNPINGGSFGVTFARGGNLTYVDSNGDLVNLRLAGGGVIDLYRQPNGEAGVVRLIGTVPGRSTISGSVRRRGNQGDGITTIERIDGLSTFGAVRSQLRTPPFVVINSTLPDPVSVSPVPAVVRAFRAKRR